MKYIATILAAAFSVSSAQSPSSLLEQLGGYSVLVRSLEENRGYLQEVVAGAGPMSKYIAFLFVMR